MHQKYPIVNYRSLAPQLLTHYSRSNDAYPLQMPINGAFMRKNLLCFGAQFYKKALTVGAHGDVFHQLIDQNWLFASQWAQGVRAGRETIRLEMASGAPSREKKALALGIHPDQMQAQHNLRTTRIEKLFGPVADHTLARHLYPEGFEYEMAFYLKHPSQPQDYLEEICADAAVDFFRACSYYRGEDLAHPSVLVRAFIREWATQARHSYEEMLDFFNLHKRPPHIMPALGRTQTEESLQAAARTWKALCKLDTSAPLQRGYLPHLYRIDEILGVAHRFDYRARFDAAQNVHHGLELRGYGYLARAHAGASGGWEPLHATTPDYLREHKQHLRALRTRGLSQLRRPHAFPVAANTPRTANIAPYALKPYARDPRPNLRLALHKLLATRISIGRTLAVRTVSPAAAAGRRMVIGHFETSGLRPLR